MFETARVVKGRRDQGFSAAEEKLFLYLYEYTRLERERAFHKLGAGRADRWQGPGGVPAGVHTMGVR
jgi:hypothetical protein